MKIINLKIHRILDYLTVVGFGVAPLIFKLDGLPATISYLLAAVHLILTLLTASLGVVRLVPVFVHGWIELVVSIALIALPFVAGFGEAARVFYIAAGAVIFVVWLLTDYVGAARPASE